MSLLMDALKKAEKAREAGGGKKPDGTESDTSQELSLDPLEATGAGEAVASEDASAGEEASLENEFEQDPETAERELSDSLSLELEEEIAEARADRGLPSLDEEQDGTLSFSGEHNVPLEDTSATLPSARAARRSVNDYFDGTGQMTAPTTILDDVGDSEPQPGPESSAGEDTETSPRKRVWKDSQSTAQAVFTAKSPASEGQGRGLWYGLGLLLLFGLGGGSYYLWSSLKPASSFSPRPLPPRATAPIATPAPQPSVAMMAPAPVAAPVEAAVMAVEPPARGDLSPGREAKATAGPATSTATTAAAPALSDEQFEAALAVAATPATLPPSPGIRITRRRAPDRIHPLLTAAYTAYGEGDHAAARSAYQKVLKREPANRDALLGMAAIALGDGEDEKAGRIYLELLSRNPHDSVAQTALMGMNRKLDPVAGESRIKQLLDREPDSTHLHFTLGNLFAAQARWAEAQGAYFEAYRRANENPDFAFNLAVSLDHLGQRESALKYYRRALELADGRSSSVPGEGVQERIRALGGPKSSG